MASLHQLGSLMSPLYPCLPVYVAPCLRGQCKLLHSSPWNCKSFHAYNYIHISNGLTYTYTGYVQQLYSVYVVQAHGLGTSVVDVMKMGNIVPRVGIEPTSLAFWVSLLPLHHIVPLMSPIYPRLRVCTAPYLRGNGSPLK